MPSLSLVSINQSFDSYSYQEMSGKIMEDFGLKLKLAEETENEHKLQDSQEEEKPQEEDCDSGEDEQVEKEEEEEEEEFSFAFVNTDGSPISADDIFQDGQIRPLFPLFNQDILFADNGDDGNLESKSSTSLRPPLKKLFVEESASETEEAEGPYCSWKGKAVDATPEVCKKSNSTGFSKLWRFTDLLHRSSSDGKDVFVFLNHSNQNQNQNPSIKSKKTEKVAVVEKKRAEVKKEKKIPGPSFHEKHYTRNRAMKEEEKRKSYLPYKQIGFFTNVNGLSRNVHPF